MRRVGALGRGQGSAKARYKMAWMGTRVWGSLQMPSRLYPCAPAPI